MGTFIQSAMAEKKNTQRVSERKKLERNFSNLKLKSQLLVIMNGSKPKQRKVLIAKGGKGSGFSR